MKLLRQEDGYSFYENPDKELVKKIQNHPKPSIIKSLGFGSGNGEDWKIKGKTEKGKLIMESSDGDLKTIEQKEYDELIKDAYLKDINATYLVSDTFAKYFAPFKNGGELLEVSDKYLGWMGGKQNFASGVNAIFVTKSYNADKNNTSYIDDSKSYEYTLSLESSIQMGSMHFTEQGEIANRDYNYDFNKPQKFISYEETKEKFLNFFKKMPKMLFVNDKWFTDNYVIEFSEPEEDDNENTCENFKLILFQIPNQGTSYYIPGNSYYKTKKPKKGGEMVNSEHLINAIKAKIAEFEQKKVQKPEPAE